jgi:hypothetical protein
MSAPLVGYLSDGTVIVMGVENPVLARSILVETLVEREELDNFGVCTEGDKGGFCDLKDDRDLCQACIDFLASVYLVKDCQQYPAYHWKEM